MSLNPFHPAVRGILEAALTQHEQARALMRVAGDETAETVERYSEIINGLTRLISLATPAEYVLPADGLEKVRGAYQMAGRLLTALADFEISSWSFGASSREVDAMLSRDTGDPRATIHEIAERIGVPYIERRHGITGRSLILAAEGLIDGIDVRIWKIITAERPFCDSHHQMLTEADVCDSCENLGIDLAGPVPDGEPCVLAAVEQLLKADDPADDDALAELLDLDDDAPVTHACSPRTGLARCGDSDKDPVFSNRPTCPTCHSLQRALPTTPSTVEPEEAP